MKEEVGNYEKLSQESEIKTIDDLRNYFDSQSQQSADADFLSHSAIAQQLFARAPETILSGKKLEDLVEIVEETSIALESLFQDYKVPHIHTKQHSRYSSIWIAMGDKPFIINSVTECIRHRGHQLQALLHPIVLHNGLRLSLVYIELSLVSDDELQLVKQLLTETLACLRLTTDDFTSILVRTETLARIIDSPSYNSPSPKEYQREVADFLHWLTDGGFIFLGYAEWSCKDETSLESTAKTTLGIYRSNDRFVADLHKETNDDAHKLLGLLDPILVTKLRTVSQVHRRQKLTNISVLEYSSNGQVKSVHSIIGLFTSKALAQESSSVPLIRQKLNALIELEQVFENSFNHKSIVNIVDSMPKDEAFRMTIEEFRQVVHTIMGIQNKHETRVNLRVDRQHRGLTALIVLPRDRFNTATRDKLQRYIEETFGARPGTSDYHLDLSNKPHARLYFYITMPEREPANINLAEIEENIAILSRTWSNNLEELILNSDTFKHNGEIWHRYRHAFSDDYQALHSVQEAQQDISYVELLSPSNPLLIGIGTSNTHGHDHSILIVYNYGSEITLSQALPVLENVGLEVINERSALIKPRASDDVYVHHFLVRRKDGEGVDPERFRTSIAAGLVSVFLEESDNDLLNSLMLSAQLSIREISLLRTYTNLLWQVSSFVSRRAILTALASHPDAAQKLWDIFNLRFDPTLETTIDARRKLSNQKLAGFRASLRAVEDITSDRILRNIASLLEHTVRTNYFHNKPEIVLKLTSQNIDIIPEPRPAYEIFVCGPSIQGVHLRGGPIARGGLRWSERYEDYRSEILGLMKTQRVKNALIVPDGAKGGFVVNNLSTNPDQIPEQVKQAYKTFIRSLLSVADNRTEHGVSHPDATVIWDDPDPYFVVAADRGTATFSDIANEIAVKEYNFWLGDAFASGGSHGYDHKLYGITAKGAWECVLHHFTELGIDYESETFSAVGIGDMSGDVFGNGMLLSKNIRLIAAFNHKHIFIDPTPKPTVAYDERQRLFELSKSQWTDYDTKLISKGGGVFNRFDKEIFLTPEIRSALAIPEECEDKLSGEELIRQILMADVDLLWNGGIGTYVKASSESNATVNDGTNDSVRIDANELRASVVGEGGNLGFTQTARIEFSRAGGLINTDAIDNSAGVDLSDHEVNLKILFSELQKSQLINEQQRNKLLEELAPAVIENVLAHNKAHALVLTVGEIRSKRNIAYFRSLIQEVHREAYINRRLEQLPDDDELIERAARDQGLSRPELAVCLSAVKLQMKHACLQSELITDKLLSNFLMKYFPKSLRTNYPEFIQDHPLAKQIIATQIANTLIDAMGVTFVHRMCLNNSVTPITVIKCALAAVLILDIQEIHKQLRGFGSFNSYRDFLFLRRITSDNLREATSWLISFHGQLTLEEIVTRYKQQYGTLKEGLTQGLAHTMSNRAKELEERVSNLELSELLTANVVSNGLVKQLFEIMWASKEANLNVIDIGKIYTSVSKSLNLTQALEQEDQIIPSNKWENELLTNSFEDLMRGISLIAIKLVQTGSTEQQQIAQMIENSPHYQQLHDTLLEIGEKRYSAAALSVVAKQIRNYLL